MSKSKKVEEKVHARLSPSGSKRWMVCPGSIALSEHLKVPSLPSRYAAEGTVAHEVHEKALVTNTSAFDFVGDKMTVDGFTFTVTESMAEAVQTSLDFIRNSIEENEALGYRVELLPEVRASLEYLGIPGLDGGTSDVVLLVFDEDDQLVEVEIVDYKHGAGVPVEAENNTQALCYALGSVHPFMSKTSSDTLVRLTISQPRAKHSGGPIRSWEISLLELLRWQYEELVPAAKRTLEDDAPLVPSEQGCRFCTAAGQCPALYKQTQEVAVVDFADAKLPSPEVMTVEQKKTVLAYADMLRSFIVAVEKQVKFEMESGSMAYEGSYKLVKRTVHRRLTDEAADPDFSPLYEHISVSELYESRLRSVGDVEKALRAKMTKDEVRELMSEFTYKPEPENVVAPISDRRRAVEASATSDFTGMGD